MAPREKSRWWRRCRIIFRRLRICVLVLILVLLGFLLYLNQVGLPGFIKRPLQNNLRARGLDLEFTRLRWRWDRGLVAENVRFGPTNAPSGPQLTAREVQVQLNYRRLRKLQFQPRGLVLRQGRLAWPILATNGAPRELSVEHIEAELRLEPDDRWELDHFQAQFAGATIRLAGSVTNASAVRDWKLFQVREPAPPGLWETRLRRLADTLEHTRFASPPQLNLDVRGDARELQSFAVRLTLKTPDANTPWGELRNGALSVQLRPTTHQATSHAEVSLQADNARTRWGNATNLALKLNLLTVRPDTNLIHADLDLTAAGVETKWGGAAAAHFNARWLQAITNAVPISGRGKWQADGVETRWGSLRRIEGVTSLFTPINPPVAADASWGGWTNLAPFDLDWEFVALGLRSPKLDVDEISSSGEWRAPRLSLARISAELYGGKLDARADLDVATREIRFRGSSDFDVQKASPLLSGKSQQWLAQYSWKVPPVVAAEGALTLPAWSNLSQADWSAEVRPTFRIEGDFRSEGWAFRGVPFSYALSHFSFSNFCWRVPDLVATRPEGRVDLVYEGSEVTHDYYFRIRSTLDPRAFRPLFETNQQRGFDLVSFTQPPRLEGEVRGRWFEPELISATARVAVTNFSLRGEWLGDLQSALEYTNLVLTLIEPRLQRGTQQMAAASIVADFPAARIYLTNGFSTADPGALTRAIGPKVGKIMEPYRFLHPPTVLAKGVIPMRDHHVADLHFEVEGGPFEWWKFKLPRIEGKVDWVGDRLTLRNVQGEFYQGTGLGNAEFDFSPVFGADFWLDWAATDADLRSLMADLTGKSNRLEGLLTARLIVTHANTTDRRSWQGGGRVNMRDGLIWAIPVFGILSPALDAIIPGVGLGSSRAREGSATYLITNGVVRSDDLEIIASKMRLQYRGSVDLQGQLDARVQAELLRDAPVIGRLLSLVFWPVTKIFEYKLTGTLQDPKSEPVFFVPKILLLPFHVFGGSGSSPAPEPPVWSNTNAPPATTSPDIPHP